MTRKNKFLIIRSVSGFFKLLFLISAILRFKTYSIGFFNRNKLKWTNSFSKKILANLFLSINYISLFFLTYDKFYLIPYIWLFFSCVWFISVILLYFEYRRRLDQTWFGLRGFWLINGIIYIIKIVFYYSFEVNKKINFLF